jgi:hypothetical protein
MKNASKSILGILKKDANNKTEATAACMPNIVSLLSKVQVG